MRNEGEHIGRLLAALIAQTSPPDEIIVVDNGSTDDTRDIAHLHDATVVEIDPWEFSFGRALNIGCAEASGDLLEFRHR